MQVAWRALEWDGMEHLWLREGAPGLDADGVVLAHVDGLQVRLAYRVRCDAAFRAREVSVELPSEGRRLGLRADGEGRWTDDVGRARPDLDGCIDVDISLTPFTNTLPIERLRLAPGESRELGVAWIEVPALTVKTQRQRYTCLRREGDLAAWRYQSGDFSADLEVDAHGLVISYGHFWRRSGR